MGLVPWVARTTRRSRLTFSKFPRTPSNTKPRMENLGSNSESRSEAG